MNARPRGRTRTRRHTFVLGVLLADLVLLAHLVVAVWTGGAARAGVQEALAEAFTTVAEHAASEVGEYVHASEQATDTVVRWIARDDPTVEEIEDRLLLMSAADDRLRVIAVAFPDDSFVAVAPGDEGSGYAYVTLVADVTADRYLLTGYGLSLEEKATAVEPFTVGGSELGFWDAAAPSSELVWTDPALRPLTGVGGAWAAQRVLDDDGEIRAIVGTDFPLDVLQAELNALPLGEDGEIYLLDKNRRVVTGPEAQSERIAQGFDQTGGVEATVLGLSPEDRATPYDIAVQVSTDGDLHTAERGLNDLGVPWVLHLRAQDSDVAPAIIGLASLFTWVTVGMFVILTFAALVYAAIWRPLREMRRAAYEDGLTGLFTRRRFMQFAPHALTDAHREGGHMCVVVLDVDHFKGLNDLYGHKEGDGALRLIGEALAAHMRSGDLVARWGGDEFVAALSMPPGKDGIDTMERLRAAAEKALLEGFPDVPDLGVTAGGARSVDGSERIEDLIRKADCALVEGKRMQKSRSYAQTP